jgi:hypothetical protein
MWISYYKGLQSISTSLRGFNLTIWKNTTFISLNSTYYNYFTLLKQANLMVNNVMKDINHVEYLIHLIKHYVY